MKAARQQAALSYTVGISDLHCPPGAQTEAHAHDHKSPLDTQIEANQPPKVKISTTK